MRQYFFCIRPFFHFFLTKSPLHTHFKSWLNIVMADIMYRKTSKVIHSHTKRQNHERIYLVTQSISLHLFVCVRLKVYNFISPWVLSGTWAPLRGKKMFFANSQSIWGRYTWWFPRAYNVFVSQKITIFQSHPSFMPISASFSKGPLKTVLWMIRFQDPLILILLGLIFIAFCRPRLGASQHLIIEKTKGS